MSLERKATNWRIMELVRTLGLFGSNGCQRFESDGKFGSGFIRGAGRWCVWLVFVFVAALITITLATVTIIAIVFVTSNGMKGG